MDEIVNKVAGSGLISLDLEEFLEQGERVLFDIKSFLHQGLMLKEKDFREQIKVHDWSVYTGKLIALHCSTDAIVPTWSYMLLALSLEPYAKKVVFGDLNDLEKQLFAEKLAKLDVDQYNGARVVIKGCGDSRVPLNAYVQIASLLKSHAKAIMFGEPCSTVPLFKSKS
jgi:hypothetical protein